VFKLLFGIKSALTDPDVRLLLGFTFAAISFASVFYWYFEGWAPLDAVYFSVVTIATIGYGDLTPQTSIGKIFTIVYVFVGLGLFVAAASAVADRIVKSQSPDR